jgi:hypothetical protein
MQRGLVGVAMKLLAASAFATASFAVFFWLALRRTPVTDRRAVAAVVLGMTALALIGGVVRGFPPATVLAVAGTAWLGLTVGTGGRIERLYGRWLTSPIKVGTGEQIRIGVAFGLVALIGVPLWLTFLGSGP